MRNRLGRLGYVVVLMASAILLIYETPALADDPAVTIKVIRNAQQAFVFDQPSVTIKAGQTIQWVSTTGRIPHQLIGDTPNDPFVDTGRFDATTAQPVVQTFTTKGVIHYHCVFHPDTLKGTITVQ